MRGLIQEVHSENVADNKQVYTFIVKTVTGIVSIQCDATQTQSNNNSAQKKLVPLPIEIRATYKRREDCDLDNVIGLYTCFAENHKGPS